MERAPRSRHVPVVFSPEEVRSILAHVTRNTCLMASLLYGSGLRLRECCTLRVKDLDFDYLQITIRDGNGGKDRCTVLPSKLVESLQNDLTRVKALHEKDLGQGFGRAPMPYALDRKYPNATREWAWQFVFPSAVRSPERRSGEICRFHLAESVFEKAVKRVNRPSVISKV